MDNKIGSIIKRGLKITVDYLITLVLFAIFLSIVLSLAKENLQNGIFLFSIFIFLLMLVTIYTNMKDVAFKEKRPQYKIKPSPYKGFLYGIIGALPIFLIQLLYYVISVPEQALIAKRRVLQAISGPFYWLASLISHDIWAYHLALLVIPVIAGLGYLAGHHEFYLMKKLNVFKNKKQDTSVKRQAM